MKKRNDDQKSLVKIAQVARLLNELKEELPNNTEEEIISIILGYAKFIK